MYIVNEVMLKKKLSFTHSLFCVPVENGLENMSQSGEYCLLLLQQIPSPLKVMDFIDLFNLLN